MTRWRWRPSCSGPRSSLLAPVPMPASLTMPASRRWAGTFSVFSPLFLLLLIFSSPAVCIFDFPSCYECQKGMKLIQSFQLNATYSYFLVMRGLSLSNDGLKTTQTGFIRFYTHTHSLKLLLPLLPTHPNWTWICPLTHTSTQSTYNHLSGSRRAAFLLLDSLPHSLHLLCDLCLLWQRCPLACTIRWSIPPL